MKWYLEGPWTARGPEAAREGGFNEYTGEGSPAEALALALLRLRGAATHERGDAQPVRVLDCEG